jgi:DNA polymerase (family 10)
MNIEHKIINLDARDYHIHTSTFSDGLNSIEEIVQFAGKIWLTEIAITDHSQVSLDRFTKDEWFYRSGARRWLKNRRNMHNDVNVIFGVEWDLLNEQWDVCFDIQKMESQFSILAAHSDIYQGDPTTITDATIRAIERHHEKIKFIAHPCNNADFWRYYDIERLAKSANRYNIPLELNGKNLWEEQMNIEKLHILLESANQIYINSDAHTLYQLQECRKCAIDFLRDNKYIN